MRVLVIHRTVYSSNAFYLGVFTGIVGTFVGLGIAIARRQQY